MSPFFNYYQKNLLSWLVPILIIVSTGVSGCEDDEHKKSSDQGKMSSRPIDTSIPQNNTDTYIAAAIETCECMQPMLDLIKNAETSKQNEDDEAMLEQESKIAKIRPQVIGCAEVIRKKYGSMESPKEQKKMLDALRKYCPDSYDILNKTISLKF